MIVAEIDGLRCGRRISTTYQAPMLDDPLIRLSLHDRLGRGGKRPHDAAVVEARDASGLAHNPWLPSGCSFSKASAWIRSASGRSCGQGRDWIVRR